MKQRQNYKTAAFLIFTICLSFQLYLHVHNQQYTVISCNTYTIHAFHSLLLLKSKQNCNFLGNKPFVYNQRRLPSNARSCLGPSGVSDFPQVRCANNQVYSVNNLYLFHLVLLLSPININDSLTLWKYLTLPILLCVSHLMCYKVVLILAY